MPLAGCSGSCWAGPPGDRRPPRASRSTSCSSRSTRRGPITWALTATRARGRATSIGSRPRACASSRAYSPAPITLPAHASIFTGLYPFDHGVRNNGNFYLADRFETLATRLKARGYRTAAFVSSFILDRRYGLARGFDTYDDRMEGAQAQVIAVRGGAARRPHGAGAAGVAGQYADSARLKPAPATEGHAAPFFAWLHLYDPHEPYRPPPPFRDAFADAPYDGEIAFDDAIVASVLDRLRQLGLLDRTLVVIAGDHGESLGDHGEETHSMFVYESALRVPLILWRPGLRAGGPGGAGPGAPDGRRADDARSGRRSPPLDGDAHAPIAACRSCEGRTDAAPPPIYAETLLPQFYMNWAPLRAIRDDRWKLIEAPRPELYDLATDPGRDPQPVRRAAADRARPASRHSRG